jgi:RHS repeat-associated protein
MTDSTGQVVWAADYKPFGEATITVSTITNNLRFPGQYYDAETGLNYNYFRDYNPEIGTYVEADPIGLDGGINLYVYANNNSINLEDPLGLFAGEDVLILAGNAARTAIAAPLALVLTLLSIPGDESIENVEKRRELEKSDRTCPPPPPKKKCNKAIKLLEQYERLADNYNLKLGKGKLQKLNALRGSGAIRKSDLPVKIQREFPDEFRNDDLNSIRKKCGR